MTKSERRKARKAARIVAECWTCKRAGRPMPLISTGARAYGEGILKAHRAAGHDVRPIEPKGE